ncbi:MAG: replicative DNA helicase, partial [Planctomycetes bacterium RBG_16_59_8]
MQSISVNASTHPAQDRVPPQAVEAETMLIGAILINNEAMRDVMETVDADAFYLRQNKIVFQAILDLFIENKPVDVIILKDELSKRGKLEEAGGAEYLSSLIDAVPSTENATHYAAIVKDKAIQRNIANVCNTILRDVMDATQSSDEVLDNAERMIFETIRKRPAKNLMKMSDILHTAFHKLTEIRDRKGRLLGLSTGFYEMDDVTCGLQGSHVIVIAGRPSMGKTSLAMRIIENVALDQNKGVLFFSLEMSAEMIAQIMLCSHCRVSFHKLRQGMISDQELQHLLLAAGRFSEAPIFIDDSSDMTLLDIRARARRIKAEHDIQLVVIDYLQQIQVRNVESRQQEIAMISRSLKAIAKELNIPVIALAQLNRDVEKRSEEHIPR